MKPGPKPRPLAERFEGKFVRGPGCWLWTAARNAKGYGCIGGTYAHRVSFRLFRGPIPKGRCVLHRCDNPTCVNPEHLFLGTRADNNADMDAKGRRRQATGERIGSAKLTADAVRQIRQLRAAGQTAKSLAARFGVRPTAIWYVTSGRMWKDVR